MPREKKDDELRVRIDPALKKQAEDYAKENGVSLAAIIRAFLRIQTDPRDPRPLPPGVEKEKERPSRRKKPPPADE